MISTGKMATGNYYQAAASTTWTGRVDGTEPELQRWHQRIQLHDLSTAPLPRLSAVQKGVALLGFACDEGVRRSKGRVGAAQGPLALRRACSPLPVHFKADSLLIDAGDVLCPDNSLEAAQEVLSEAVLGILSAGYLPVLLGGGHEITYGHVRGIYKFLQQQATSPKAGLINFDAHFDLRIPGPDGPSSGTSFWQLAQDCKQQKIPYHYLALGIQQHSNTPQLFRIATELGVQQIPADAFHMQDKTTLNTAIQSMLEQAAHLYLTIDLDAFAAPFAPGVSATAFNGILPGGIFMECYRTILQSGKVTGIDIAELNPTLDIDARTAKLGAALIYEAVQDHLS
jgi:formiminoglutamase